MNNLVKHITEYSQINDDIDVSELIKQSCADTRTFMIYYGNDTIVDVVSYNSEDDITGDDEHTTDRVTSKIWNAEVGDAVKCGQTIWCRIK